MINTLILMSPNHTTYLIRMVPSPLFFIPKLIHRQEMEVDQDVLKCIKCLIRKSLEVLNFQPLRLLTPPSSPTATQTAAWAPFNLLGLVAGLSLQSRCPLAPLHFPFSPLSDH